MTCIASHQHGPVGRGPAVIRELNRRSLSARSKGRLDWLTVACRGLWHVTSYVSVQSVRRHARANYFARSGLRYGKLVLNAGTEAVDVVYACAHAIAARVALGQPRIPTYKRGVDHADLDL